jgi:predicted TIM-barrel fold metal-dependent hydrolase
MLYLHSGRRMKMLIDLHLHTVRSPGLLRSRGDTFATPAQLVERMDEIGISRGVLLPIVSPEGGHLQVLTEEVLEAAREFPGRFISFCNVDPRADTNTAQADLGRILDYYIDKGCRGLGEITANIPWDDPRVHNLFAACQSRALPVTFHIGPQSGGCYGLIDEPGLPGLERALQRFPGLTFLGHSQPFWAEIAPDYGEAGRNGYPKGPVRPGGRLPELFARYPNLCGDLSAGSGHNAVSRDPEFGCHFMEMYQDRLFFATDICSPGDDTPLVRYLAAMADEGRLSRQAYEKITWRNANKLLNLGL